MEFAFGDHLLDVDRRELRRGDDLIAVEPQVFDIWFIWCRTAIAWSANSFRAPIGARLAVADA